MRHPYKILILQTALQSGGALGTVSWVSGRLCHERGHRRHPLRRGPVFEGEECGHQSLPLGGIRRGFRVYFHTFRPWGFRSLVLNLRFYYIHCSRSVKEQLISSSCLNSTTVVLAGVVVDGF